MGDLAPVGEAQEIARLVARACGVDLDLPSRERLKVGVAREHDPPGRVGCLDQSGAIDPPLGAPAPQIRSAGEPAQRPLRGSEETRLGSELRFRPDDARTHTPGAPVTRLDLPVPTQRDARPHRQPQALILELELGTERASGGPRAPVLRPFGRSDGQISGMGPRVVAVARSHAEPHVCLASLEQRERLAVQRLAHPVGRDPRLAQQRCHRGRDHGRRLVTDRGVGEQPDVRRTAGIGRDAPQLSQSVAARGAAVQVLGLDGHLEHAEPRIGHPFPRDVRDIAPETVSHGRRGNLEACLSGVPTLGHSGSPTWHQELSSASPGISPTPRASRTARSTAVGTASAARASACSGVAGTTAAVLTANTRSPSNRVP